MNILHISNTLNEMVRQSDFFRSYHFGYHSDINANIGNDFDPDGNAGKSYPHVTWVAPVEGELSMQGETGRDAVEMMLLFYATQDYRDDNDPVDITQTLAWQWNRLKLRAVEFVHGLNKSKAFRVVDGRVKWFTDSNANIDRLICVGLEFKLLHLYACCDYQFQQPPLSAADTHVPSDIDLETRYVR